MASTPLDPHQQLFELALQRHRAGGAGEAERLYRQIISARPDHAGATHYLGVLYQQAGQSQAALQLIQRALALRPDWPEAYYNLGFVLKSLGQWEPAIAALRRAIALRPTYVEAFNNLSLALSEQGKLEESIAVCRQIIAIKPGFAEAHNNLGLALQKLGRLDEAIAALGQAVAVRPDYAEGYNNLAIVLRDRERFDEAIAACQRAIALRGDYAEAHNNLGVLLKDVKQYAPSVVALRRAIELKPEYAEALSNLGNSLRAAGRLEEAIAAFGQAIALRPGAADFQGNLGNALRDHNQLDLAIEAFGRAIALRPDFAVAYNDWGNALKDQGKLGEAIVACRKAIAIEPGLAEAHNNLALLLLMNGKFTEGWREYEWRWRWKDFPSPRIHFHQPVWDGSELGGRTILLAGEQGFGDVIQFVRYAPMVAAGGGKVIVGCSPKLTRLLETAKGIWKVLPSDQPLPPFDVHCRLLDLPGFFGTTVETIPADVPYLHADESRVQAWRKWVDAEPGEFKVGLAWAGNPAHLNDRNRSMPLAAFAPLAEIPGVRFYNLQLGEAGAQAKESVAGLKLIDVTDRLEDFADTAALMANLDLVIAVDTVIVHLAGALGKAVWTLLPFVPDWRWMMQSGDSPWYPTMRLFRQPRAGDWSSVVQLVKRELSRLRSDSVYWGRSL